METEMFDIRSLRRPSRSPWCDFKYRMLVALVGGLIILATGVLIQWLI